MHLKIIGGLTVFLVLVGVGAVDVVTVIQQLSKEERRKFFTYQLFLGYFQRHANDLTHVPEEVTSKIYDYFLSKYGIKEIDEYNLNSLTCQWIKVDGECIDPDDPGIYPELSAPEENV